MPSHPSDPYSEVSSTRPRVPLQSQLACVRQQWFHGSSDSGGVGCLTGPPSMPERASSAGRRRAEPGFGSSRIAEAEANSLDAFDQVVEGHGRCVVAESLRNEPDEVGLVQADGRGPVQPLAIRLEERTCVGRHRVVDRVPVAVELARHLQHRPPRAHLNRGPLSRSGGEEPTLARDAVVREHPGSLG